MIMSGPRAGGITTGTTTTTTTDDEHRRQPRSRRRRRRVRTPGTGPPAKRPCASVSEIIDSALKASRTEARGINVVDGRFRWRVLGAPAAPRTGDVDLESAPLEGSSPANVTHHAPKHVPNGFYASVLGDEVLTRDALLAIQLRIAAVSRAGVHATLIVGGSTGMRLIAGRRDDSTFPISDIDVDAYAPDEAGMSAIVAALDEACTDIVLDRDFERGCSDRVPHTLQTEGCRTNSRLYISNDNGAAVSVDVPKLSEHTARLRHCPVFATRNDTLNGMTLHRIRLAIKARPGGDGSPTSDEDVPRSVPLIDVKSRVGTPPKTVERRVAGLRVRVPTAREAAAELKRLLGREYEGVDAAKDGMRERQLEALQHDAGAPRTGRSVR